MDTILNFVAAIVYFVKEHTLAVGLVVLVAAGLAGLALWLPPLAEGRADDFDRPCSKGDSHTGECE
ncbi:hypothetical protein ACFPA8_12395 [Streptomyces ovatisporus]|uniref:Uncharacterized protein n=1 Tax=Streptomyces ovatisporus TaxID=1128682 RepID=A0ABV9A5A8_9ACTN